MMVLLMLMEENFGYHDEIGRRVDNMVSIEERWGTMVVRKCGRRVRLR
jgi:hypothetical protein